MPSTKQERQSAFNVIAMSYRLMLMQVLPINSRIEMYCKYMSSIDDKSFELFGVELSKIYPFRKGKSKEYKNAEKELTAIIALAPRLDKFRSCVYDNVKRHRTKYKLNI